MFVGVKLLYVVIEIIKLKRIKKMVTYTKRDIVRTVADQMDVPLNQAEPWVDSVIDALRSKMLAADPTRRIELRNFGGFEVKKTKSKTLMSNLKTND